MLDISRSERYFILAALTLSSLWLVFSYLHKTLPAVDMETSNIEETQTLININEATAFQLEGLPGIGPVLARDILLYRQRSGGFKDIEELKNIKGIGEKKFKKIKEFIAVEDY